MPTLVRVRCDELAELAVINRRDIRPRNVSGPTIRVTYGGILTCEPATCLQYGVIHRPRRCRCEGRRRSPPGAPSNPLRIDLGRSDGGVRALQDSARNEAHPVQRMRHAVAHAPMLRTRWRGLVSVLKEANRQSLEFGAASANKEDGEHRRERSARHR